MASVSNLFVDHGSDFEITLSLTDSVDNALSLSGATFLGQVRKSHGSNTVKATFTTSNDGTGGNLTVKLTDVQTASLDSGRYVYDIIQTASDGLKTRLIEGQLIVTPSVSRS